LYGQINLLNSLMIRLLASFLESGVTFEISKRESSETHLENSLSWVKNLCILEQIWLGFKAWRMGFGCVGRANTKVGLFLCILVYPGVIPSLQVRSRSVEVKILVGFKNLGVFLRFKSEVFEGFCNSFDIECIRLKLIN